MEEIKEPSYYIREEMQKADITAKELSERLNISKQHLNKFINQSERISHKMAIRLANAFEDTTAEYWLKKQMEYDLITIRKN